MLGALAGAAFLAPLVKSHIGERGISSTETCVQEYRKLFGHDPEGFLSSGDIRNAVYHATPQTRVDF